MKERRKRRNRSKEDIEKDEEINTKQK